MYILKKNYWGSSKCILKKGCFNLIVEKNEKGKKDTFHCI